MESDKSEIRISPSQLSSADFTYPLPDDKIARFPLPIRTDSKILWANGMQLTEGRFFDLIDWLPNDSMLVFNDTRVIHARLIFERFQKKPIEVFCLESVDSAAGVWKCMVGNARQWKEFTLVWENENGYLRAEKIRQEGKMFYIQFTWLGFDSFESALDAFGHVPLPPYLKRADEISDKSRYQTVFAERNGSVAAPTASLHFNEEMMDRLAQKGITWIYVTLHVGAGTFWPMESSNIGEHIMHSEKMEISAGAIFELANHKGPIIPVGTTALRTVESLYHWAVKFLEKPVFTDVPVWCHQWEPYDLNDSPSNSWQNTLLEAHQKLINAGKTNVNGTTQLMIAPGYSFHIASGLITNFHQPGSTLLVLVAATLGNYWKTAYHYALEHNFRFLSYGDSMWIYPFPTNILHEKS